MQFYEISSVCILCSGKKREDEQLLAGYVITLAVAKTDQLNCDAACQ